MQIALFFLFFPITPTPRTQFVLYFIKLLWDKVLSLSDVSGSRPVPFFFFLFFFFYSYKRSLKEKWFLRYGRQSPLKQGNCAINEKTFFPFTYLSELLFFFSLWLTFAVQSSKGRKRTNSGDMHKLWQHNRGKLHYSNNFIKKKCLQK